MKMYQVKIPMRGFVEQFFTFLVPMVDRQGQPRTLKWRSEASLKQQFQTYEQQNVQVHQACDNEDDSAIVRDLLQLYQQVATPVRQKSIAQWHLAAYLEAPVYQAAGDRFHAYRDYNAPDKTWEHYLYIAQCIAANSEKVAEIYQRYKPEKESLNQHFRLELASKIRDVFHQETGQGKYSIWYALKRVSERELKRRLTASGIEEARLAAYIAVRDALFEVYSKTGDRWLEPSAEHYRQATDYFNRHYSNHQYFNRDYANRDYDTSVLGEKNTSTLTLELFRAMLATCIKANQFSPAIESLDDDRNKSLVTQENLLLDSPLLHLEEEQSTQDFKARLEAMHQRLCDQFQQLEEKDQHILQLQAQGLNQTQIATQLGINQGTVSRRYQRSQRQLLSAIAHWLQSEHQISLNSISLNSTEQLALYIEGWVLRQYAHEAPTTGSSSEVANRSMEGMNQC
jgi:RNA polymerase sigma factor (sigma-70 family)